MRALLGAIVATVILLGGAGAAVAQDTTHVRRDTGAVTTPTTPPTQPAPSMAPKGQPPGLPPVPFDSAYMTARTAVPTGAALSEADLERENGVWRYEFKFKVPGQTGDREVKVDATTGKIMKAKGEM
ncbi:MAG TPA: PepSY domain-containing protein [Longimicrobiales bacterium]|nr:PepSY domain-containing protein [Longimicrobiales bacterium]